MHAKYPDMHYSDDEYAITGYGLFGIVVILKTKGVAFMSYDIRAAQSGDRLLGGVWSTTKGWLLQDVLAYTGIAVKSVNTLLDDILDLLNSHGSTNNAQE